MKNISKSTQKFAKRFPIEKVIGKRIEQLWEVDLEEQKELTIIDFVIFKDDNFLGFLETKRKHCNFSDFNSILISERKWDEFKRLQNKYKKDIYFVISFNHQDYVYHFKLNDYKHFLKEHLKNNSGQSSKKYDIVIHIPIEHMVKIEDFKFDPRK